VRVRRWLHVLHRDIGYLLFVLTVVYSVSGIAVNHIHDWNPNYRREARPLAIGPVVAADLDGMEAEVVARAGIDPALVTGRHRTSPTDLVLFLPEGGEVRVDLVTGVGEVERLTPRLLLFESNVLHLNKLRGTWTLVADAFAALLLFLAVSGVLLLRGRTGLAGRGKWLVGAGLVVPVVFVWLYYAGR
jgi:uncharacterized protein